MPETLNHQQTDETREQDEQDKGAAEEGQAEEVEGGQNDELNQLRERLDVLNRREQHIRELEFAVAEAEDEWSQRKEAAKIAKQRYEQCVRSLRAAVRRRDDPQQELPFGDEPEAGDDQQPDTVPFDEGAGQPIGELGMTKSETETLIEHDIKTVGDLEQVMRSDEWWHRNIKGFGEAKVTKLTDALMEFRKQYPVPSVESSDDGESGSKPESTEVPTPDDALTFCDELMKRAKRLPDRAIEEDFDPVNTIGGIQDTILETDHVTEDQWRALQNIAEGIAGWGE